MDASPIAEARQGDRRSLGRLLRVVEDRRDGYQAVLFDAWKSSGSAHMVGITGSPGSGKSTLTNALIATWRALDRRVGVVAVDPSSPFSGGALLGDRIRMQDHVSDPGVFVRSMSSRGRLGGVAATTAGLVTLLDAVGFDPVVIETVGVGQSEVDVIDHTDTVVVVLSPGSGDAIQGEKAGILEIGDIYVINKADMAEAAETRRWLSAMLELSAARPWQPPIVETVATDGRGVEELADALDRHHRHLIDTDEGWNRKRRRARAFIHWAITDSLSRRLEQPDIEAVIDQVVARVIDPWAAAEALAPAER